MKKYMPVLLVFSLLITLLGFNANFASAEYFSAGGVNGSIVTGGNLNVSSASGCTSAGPYNTLTGQLCVASTQSGCLAGYSFDPLTGKACSSGNTSGGGSFVSTSSQLISIGSQGNDVRSIQQILKDQGYSVGTVDGNYGRRTARAVSDFQYDNDLEVTGKVNSDTLAKLKSLGFTPIYTPSTAIQTPMPTQIPTQSALSLSCDSIALKKQYYINLCRDEGSENACFNKYSGEYQGCTRNANNDCTENNMNSAQNILCSVGLTQPIIAASTSEGGKIYPSGKIAVSRGSNQTFVFYPDAGYQVSSINIDNKSTLPAAPSYTFSNVTGSHLIAPIFSPISTPVIQPSITVISPNGGENYSAGQKYTLTWQSAGLPVNTNYSVVYTRLGGGVTETKNIGSTNNSYFDWTIPTTLTPGNYQIYVYRTATGLVDIYGDFSNSFTITAPTTQVQPTLTIKGPIPFDSGQGVQWTLGETKVFYWSTTGIPSTASGFIELIGNGNTYRIINNISNSGSYTWTVNYAGLSAGTYSVKIAMNGVYGVSYPLIITAPTVVANTIPTVTASLSTTSPNPGQSVTLSGIINGTGYTGQNCFAFNTNGGSTPTSGCWSPTGANPSSGIGAKSVSWLAGAVDNFSYTFFLCANGASGPCANAGTLKVAAPVVLNNTIPPATQTTTPPPTQTNTNKVPIFRNLPSGPSTLTIGTNGTWTASAYDPDGAVINFYVSWGDGTSPGGGVTYTFFGGDASGSFSHTYTVAGNYTLTVKATDSLGAYTTATTSVSVSAPTVSDSQTNLPATQTTTAPLSVYCSASPASPFVGDTVTWTSIVSGGTGVYTHSWSGDEGLSGSGGSITTVYSTAGYKSSYVTVTSGSSAVKWPCSVTVQSRPASPSIDYFKANNSSSSISVSSGTAVTLSWSSSGTSRCSALGDWNNNIATFGSATLYPTISSSYNIACFSLSGDKASAGIFVTVTH